MRYIITSGPMETAIDDVRRIKNSSTGSLGKTFANQLVKRGYDDIIYIHTAEAAVPEGQITKVLISDHQELLTSLKQYAIDDCVVIHAMAISDFNLGGSISLSQLANTIYQQLDKVQTAGDIEQLINSSIEVKSKLASSENQVVVLNQAIKVIDQIKQICPSARLVGFKLLSNVSKEQLLDVANGIKKRANCEVVVANLKEEVSLTKHKAYIITNGNTQIANTKQEIANLIIDLMEE